MNELEFRVDTCALLNELADCALTRDGAIFKIPLNIFKNLLAQVAKRAIELNDDELHCLMLKLGLYEVDAGEIPAMIDKLEQKDNPKN